MAIQQVIAALRGRAVNTISLLPMNGANGGTTFNDEVGFSWSPSGNAQTSTAQSQFGGSSLLLDGTGDFLTAPSRASFAFGTGDFTVEWFQRWGGGKIISPIDFRGGTANSPRLLVYNANSSPFTDLRLFVNNADQITAPTGTLVANTWQHIAVCRSGTNTRMFVAGTQVGSTWTTDSTSYTAADWLIGRNTATTARDFNGYMQAFRASNIARYTANFTPPSFPFVLD